MATMSATDQAAPCPTGTVARLELHPLWAAGGLLAAPELPPAPPAPVVEDEPPLSGNALEPEAPPLPGAPEAPPLPGAPGALPLSGTPEARPLPGAPEAPPLPGALSPVLPAASLETAAASGAAAA